MNETERGGWGFRTWSFMFLLVAALQVLFFVALSNHSPARPKRWKPVPSLRVFETSDSPLLPLLDPTLFALPHRETFSGEAWMEMSRAPSPGTQKPDKPSWLGLDVSSLTPWHSIIRSNKASVAQIPLASPALSATEIAIHSALSEPSRLLMHCYTAPRQLLADVSLPSWRHDDLLASTTLRVLINAAGKVVSETLLGRSGKPEADTWALQQAKSLKFAPLIIEGPGQQNKPADRLAWCELEFAWQTLPLDTTNVPAVLKTP